MRKSYKILSVLGILLLMSFTADKCFILRNNIFKYRNAKKDVIVVFQENTHTEYHNNKEHFIKSDIEWGR